MHTNNNPSDSTRPSLHDLTDEELFTAARAEITDTVNQLSGLPLLRALESIAAIAEMKWTASST